MSKDNKQHHFDVTVVGGGLAGLSAALEVAAQGFSVALVSKVHPLRSHTGAAQGGIAAAIGSDDSPQWHVSDTLAGGVDLADRDAVELLCAKAPETIEWLSSLGVPFSRNEQGDVAQRRFGGHTKGDQKSPVERACYAADRTGLAILNSLWEKLIHSNVTLFNEYHVLKLLCEDKHCYGFISYNLSAGQLEIFHSKATILATGGYGQVYDCTTNPLINTGDGAALVLQEGYTLQDMEFMQFHPTALFPQGHLISEAARAEGGILRNEQGQAFMEKYAPDLKELAPRDVVSRALWHETQKQEKAHCFLDLTHLSSETLAQKLPQITDLAETFGAVDPTKDMIPVAPAAHYSMGGIPVTLSGAVLADGLKQKVSGLYAVGEAAVLSVHGANRLGCNSLLEAAVFGRKCGQDLFADLPTMSTVAIPTHLLNQEEHLLQSGKADPRNFYAIKKEIQQTMSHGCGLMRTETDLIQTVERLQELESELEQQRPPLEQSPFNTIITDFFETHSLSMVAQAVCTSALKRCESRGAHSRLDFPEREAASHSLVKRTGEFIVTRKSVQL